jgi:hypothetical protein
MIYTNPVRHILKRHNPQAVVVELAASGLDIYNITQKRAQYSKKNFVAWLGTFPKHKLEAIATKLDKQGTYK